MLKDTYIRLERFSVLFRVTSGNSKDKSKPDTLDLGSVTSIASVLLEYHPLLQWLSESEGSVIFKDKLKNISMTFKENLDMDWHDKLTD